MFRIANLGSLGLALLAAAHVIVPSVIVISGRPAYGQVFLDADVTADIQHQLRLDPVVANDAIEVEASAGAVTLRGTVHNMAAWGRAGLIAERVRGVRYLINDLALDTLPRKIDTGGERAVRDAILRTGIVRPGQIMVDLDGSVATVLGTADSWTQHDELMRVIRSSPGISLVRDRVEVAPTALPNDPLPPHPPEGAYATDERVFGHVRELILADPYIGPNQVRVSVIDGKVYLFGMVASSEDRSYAESLAALVPGVVTVENQLAIRR